MEAEIPAGMHKTVRRPVVTAFIRRDDGKLLVVRRSNKVGTYQQHWGGVSGGVEGSESLLDRALTEIAEEVGLTAQQLQLVCFGRPLPVDDGRRRFLVYPFLFQLTDPAAHITLNWENVAYDWVSPSAIPALHHVPLLPETVRRLLLPAYMQKHVQYLKSDREHGASELAAYVLQALRAAEQLEERSTPTANGGSSSSSSSGSSSSCTAECAASWPSQAEEQQQQQQQQDATAAGAKALAAPEPQQQADAAAAAAQPEPEPQPPRPAPATPSFEGTMEAYRNFCFHMAVARPSMAAVANAAADVMLQLQQQVAARADAFEPTVGLARVALNDTITKLSAQRQRQQAATVSNTAALLKGGMTVMTTSLSSTVVKALTQAHQKALEAAPAAAAAAPAAAQVEAPPAAVGSPSSLSAGISIGASGDVLAAASGGSVFRRPSIDGDDWVDDPEFWPSSSGIGREPLESAASSSPLERKSSSGGGSSSSSSSSSGRKGKGPGISVFVCESRPLCEGVNMARRLAAAGLDVTVITDAQAGVFVDQVDLVLIGADAVTPAGVVNKVGSKLITLAARAARVPVVAVTDSLKISPGPVSAIALPNTSLSEGEEEKEVSEVMAGWGGEVAAAVEKLLAPKDGDTAVPAAAAAGRGGGEETNGNGTNGNGTGGGVSSSAAADASVLAPGGSIAVRNVYFECVPLSYMTGLVTDKGLMSQFHVAQLIKQRAKDYQQAFGIVECA